MHTVSKTASKDFVELPVETIMTNILGTQNMLEIAKKIMHINLYIYLLWKHMVCVMMKKGFGE